MEQNRRSMVSRMAFALIAIALFCACREKIGGPVVSNDLTLDEGASNRDVVMEVGGTMEVRLTVNYTTPVRWTGPVSDNSGIYEVVSEDYVPDEAPEGVTGVGGTAVWKLRAVSPGHATIRWSTFHVGEPEELTEGYKIELDVK